MGLRKSPPHTFGSVDFRRLRCAHQRNCSELRITLSESVTHRPVRCCFPSFRQIYEKYLYFHHGQPYLTCARDGVD